MTSYPQAALRPAAQALESERARREVHERMPETPPYDPLPDLDRVIGILAGALLSRPYHGLHGLQGQRDERVAEYARLRDAGFSREQAADKVRVYSRTTIGRYEQLRARQGAA